MGLHREPIGAPGPHRIVPYDPAPYCAWVVFHLRTTPGDVQVGSDHDIRLGLELSQLRALLDDQHARDTQAMSCFEHFRRRRLVVAQTQDREVWAAAVIE